MAEVDNSSVQGVARLLYRVPKSALITALGDLDPEVLKQTYQTVTGRSTEASLATIGELTFTPLIKIFQRATAGDETLIRHLHEEFRYRGMKSLYLYEATRMPNSLAIAVHDINSIVAALQTAHREANPDTVFSRLQFRSMEDIEDATQLPLELPYSYVTVVQVVNPNSELPELVKDLRQGFVWLHTDQAWMAICARDEAINELLAATLREYLGCSLTQLHFPKTALRLIEPKEQLRRAGFHNAATGTNRRLTNPNMAQDPQAMEEFRERDDRDERPVSGYNQIIPGPDGRTFALGYSNDRGKIFFSCDLTATQMRAWAPGKIQTIVTTIRSLRVDNPADLIQAAASQILRGVEGSTRESILEIARAVVACKTGHLSETTLPRDALTYQQALENRVNACVRVNCDVCQETLDVRCESCQRTNIRPSGESLVCANCGQIITLSHVECSDGHVNLVGTLADLVHLVPRGNLQGPLATLVLEATGQPFNIHEEAFYIRGARLFYQSAAGRVVHTFDDIPELVQLAPQSPPEPLRSEIRTALDDYKEKHTGCMSDDQCSTCVSERHNAKCYLRLFGLWDPSYTPRPHHGHEFGDYSRIVTLEGRQTRLAIAMKGGNPTARPITQRGSSKGQDIYSQVGLYRYDGAIGVIGICCPQRLEEGFQARLVADARAVGKKLMFIGDADLCRIVYGAMQSHGLSLDEL